MPSASVMQQKVLAVPIIEQAPTVGHTHSLSCWYSESGSRPSFQSE